MVDLHCRLGSETVRDLLDQLEYPEKIRQAKTAQILAEYRDHPDQPILGIESEGELVALIGLRLDPPCDAIIRHIVVRRDRRGLGLGHEMVTSVCQMFSLKGLAAETDRDAVEFYRAVGFEIESLGEKYPGTERFLCRRKTKRQEPKTPFGLIA